MGWVEVYIKKPSPAHWGPVGWVVSSQKPGPWGPISQPMHDSPETLPKDQRKNNRPQNPG
jgi:hypothetical protein